LAAVAVVGLPQVQTSLMGYLVVLVVVALG
jgi:hypothetical protein